MQADPRDYAHHESRETSDGDTPVRLYFTSQGFERWVNDLDPSNGLTPLPPGTEGYVGHHEGYELFIVLPQPSTPNR